MQLKCMEHLTVDLHRHYILKVYWQAHSSMPDATSTLKLSPYYFKIVFFNTVSMCCQVECGAKLCNTHFSCQMLTKMDDGYKNRESQTWKFPAKNVNVKRVK